MPKVRDPKTGRFTSAGGSSYEAGATAPTNPRIQKAKAVGSGSTLLANPIPQLSADEVSVIYSVLKGKEGIVYDAPVEDVSLSNVHSIQDTLRVRSVQHFSKGGKAKDHPVILKTAGRGNVVLDGNHRVSQALKEGKTTIKAHYVMADDLLLSPIALKAKYKSK